MEKGKLRRKYKIFLLSACCFIFVLSIIGVFTFYQHLLNEKFHSILTNNLEENATAQKNRAELIISNLQDLLDMLQNTFHTSEFTVPTQNWEQDNRIRIDYLDAAQIRKISSSSKLSDNGKLLCSKLMAGEEVITDLGEPELTDGSSLLALLQPVFHDDNFTGVFRAQVDASLLIDGNMDSISFFQKVYIILTKPDGSVIYANTPYPNKQNFLSAALQGGISADAMEPIQRAFKENDEKTLSFYGKGNKYYISWKTLSFNNWRVVWFARSPDVILQTKTLLKGMIFTGICLIVLTVLFCAVMIRLLLRQKHRLETQQRRYDALAQFNDTLLFEYDVISNRVVFTPNALERLDLDDKYLEGVPGEYYKNHLLHPDDRENVHQAFEPSSIILGETYYVEARFRCRDGKYNWFGCQFKSIENQKKRTSQVIGKLVDISDQRGREQLLRQAALADVLTGVYNRSAETIINNLLQEKEQGLFFMIDLDNFKNVNDTHGHAIGDALLIHVAQILKEVFRSDDIIARVGGDEFIAFISGTNDPKVAKSKAEVIQSHMENLYISGIHCSISASIGAASAPQNGSTYDALTRAADQAMYTIKQQSKKGFAFHESEN